MNAYLVASILRIVQNAHIYFTVLSGILSIILWKGIDQNVVTHYISIHSVIHHYLVQMQLDLRKSELK